ncbi:MAG TPA: hypothetical protein VHO69_01180 [Phototrophicaceae bacterium]|nr:hypothetical protein [Phototrophicaceae bacterium]
MNAVANLIRQYIPPGFFKGSTFLLPPKDAVRFVDNLIALKIATFGVGCWFYHQGDPIPIEDSYFFFAVETETLESPDRVSRSGELVKNFLNTNLPAKYTLVQITFDITFEQWKEIWRELDYRF